MDDLILTCQDEQRRYEVRKQKYGLDYLEVSDDQRVLTVYFLGKAPPEDPKIENVIIKGGRRVRDIRVTNLDLKREKDSKRDDRMLVTVDKPGDFSTYTLCLVEVVDGRATDQPLAGFDPHYACLEFSFMANCPSDLDCKATPICPSPERRELPEINYLAKDYASFRQLILDRLALLIPDWQERHVPDVGITLVELLAYVGDYLSYYQDAVATEAYLETARQRISVRRHARLVDYLIHEGCNARAFVSVETDVDNLELEPQAFYFLTGKTLRLNNTVLTENEFKQENIPSNQYEVFEPLIEKSSATIHLYQAHNTIHFYTWGDQECCLPRGATSATLKDGTVGKRVLQLQPGDILLFEEVINPQTGNSVDADPKHRHAVRLTNVDEEVDALYQQPVLEITWTTADALPFPLCISALGPTCELLENISVVRGNVILVDHGQHINEKEMLGKVSAQTRQSQCEGKDRPGEVEMTPVPFRPVLQKAPLTFSQPLPSDAAASQLLVQMPQLALPQIDLTGTYLTPHGEQITQWTAKPDLLDSQPEDRDFVVEIDDEGRAHLRFGEGELGEMPAVGTLFQANYRLGNGPVGNVGAETISHMVFRNNKPSGVELRPRNLLPAQGGITPEPVTDIKLFAPYALRHTLQRAITAEDYADLVMRDFKSTVQRAAASLRWTGSGYEVLVAIDPLGKTDIETDLLTNITTYLCRYRRMGHDVKVALAHYVPLDVELTVCVLPHFLRAQVKAALLDVFSNRILSDGRLGFFHPDNLSFGEGVYLSKLVATAQAVRGVESVTVTRLKRQYEKSTEIPSNGILKLGPLEIARLDNDPNFPEYGKFHLNMGGGR
ncbi:MAG: putative baseplate assembly protein [Thioploca sp.]|nr:putative baseplate assembly protein [Thioploca sp.]